MGRTVSLPTAGKMRKKRKKRKKPPYPSGERCELCERSARSLLLRFRQYLPERSRRGPADCVPAVGRLAVTVEGAQACELLEGTVDAIEFDMALEEADDLGLREAIVRGFDGFTDAVGYGVSRAEAEEVGGAFVAILPDGEGGFEVGRADKFTGIEGGVECAEAEDLSLGATGGSSMEAGLSVTVVGIVSGPHGGCFLIAAEKDCGTSGGPDGGAAEFAGRHGQIMRGRASAFGQALSALDPGPEAAVGKAVVGLFMAEVAGQFLLRDVGDQAEVRCGNAE